jgi:hypothetical protein
MIAAPGTRKNSDPGTHMITPAIIWSLNGVVPAMRGTFE